MAVYFRLPSQSPFGLPIRHIDLVLPLREAHALSVLHVGEVVGELCASEGGRAPEDKSMTHPLIISETPSLLLLLQTPQHLAHLLLEAWHLDEFAGAVEVVALDEVDVVVVEAGEGVLGGGVELEGGDEDEFEAVGSFKEGELVLLGPEVLGLRLDVGVEDADEVRHGGGGALQVADAVRVLQLAVVHLLLELLRVDVVHQRLILENQKLVNSLLHHYIISLNNLPLITPSPLLQVQFTKPRPMSMNTRDERLYHYEYRRPRISNPTYNSSHVFDSLHMMIRPPAPNASYLRSYGRYSLEGNDTLMGNRSDVVSGRPSRAPENTQGQGGQREGSRQARLLSDKDSLYLQMLEEKGRARSGRSNGFDMGSSQLSQNAEHSRQEYAKPTDSLAREVQEFNARGK